MTSQGPTNTERFRDRLAAARRVWRERWQAFPLAYSTDGRSFAYHAPVTSEIVAGGYVRITTEDGRVYLGHVVSKEVGMLTGPSIRAGTEMSDLQEDATGDVSEMSFQLTIRRVEGEGTILGRIEGERLRPTGAEDRFEDEAISPAYDEDIILFLERRVPRHARLDIGRVAHGEGRARAYIDASGFNRHTFMCGQSGSGKTYSLGVVLERIMSETDLRVVILDPNSDYVRLREMRPAGQSGEDGGLATIRERYAAVRERIRVLRPAALTADGEHSLRIHFSDLRLVDQGLVLGLDPLRDRGEFDALRSITERLGEDRYDVETVLVAAQQEFSPDMRELALRISNLGVARWGIWARFDQTSIPEQGDDWRVLVLDIGGLEHPAEASVVAMSVLGRAWQQRACRQPVLIVMDEAHNICPAVPANALQAAGTDHVARIAAEGRKYGLYLLMASQRPDKVDRNVLSQCDNLLLMRMNSHDDIGALASVFSFVPATLLEKATGFRQGEALVAGKIAPAPMFVQFGARISEEGGSDVQASWVRSAPRRE